MKKSLLLASMFVAGLTASAAVDPATYTSGVEGYTFTPLMMNTERGGAWKSYFSADPAVPGLIPAIDQLPTATTQDGKIYVSSCKKATDDGGTVDEGQFFVFDLNTGDYIKTLQLTCDGAPIAGTLSCANVNVDDFGNLWFSGYVGSLYVNGETSQYCNLIKFYTVNPENGECTLQAQLGLTEDNETVFGTVGKGRVDFTAVSGDITRTQAPCTVMFAGAGAGVCAVIGWHAEQGSDEWEGAFDGENILILEEDQTYPKVTQFGQAVTIDIIPDDNYEGQMFYLDDFTTLPALYNNTGAMLESFADVVEAEKAEDYPADKVCTPPASPTGLCEFAFGDDTFLLYPFAQHDKEPGVRARLVKLGEGASFAAMQKVADFPEGGMGMQVGGGRRIHCFNVNVMEDAAGKHAAHIFTYRHGNGFATYLFAENGYDGAGVAAPVVDANAPVEYFNLQGIRVENPSAGLYIRRQGANVAKVVL